MLKNKLTFFCCICFVALASTGARESIAATSAEYVATPPFVTSGAPPLVMLVMGRDHKLYYEAYNDASDLDGDGELETRYKPSIEYYGYFDSYKYYKYENGIFVPKGRTIDKKAPDDDVHWSGDFLNYLTMSRIDVMRKVLYGGYRKVDTDNKTVLERAYIPNDAHCWGKEYVALAGKSRTEIISDNGYNIEDYTPYSVPTAGHNHLFATGSVAAPALNSADCTPLLRVALDSNNRVSEWVTVESGTGIMGWGLVDGTHEADINVRVQVGVTGLHNIKNEKLYTNTSTGTSVYKPTGILQRFGENRSMLFGLMSGSYENHLSGGVLRKNIGPITDEINPETGQFLYKTDSNVGGIIKTIDYLKIIGFNHGDHLWDYKTYIAPIEEGQNYMWGNPIGEMMYESLRYFAGETEPTAAFSAGVSNGDDRGLALPLENWQDPYAIATDGGLGYPTCAKPFMLVLSDINPSYDTDQLPGVYSKFAGSPSFAGSLGAFDAEGLADDIFAEEGLGGGSEHYIGQSNTLFDTACSAKVVDGFGTIRGLCPEEPTKMGGYYSASVALFGKTHDISTTADDDQNVTTYAVALASPLPRIEIPLGSKRITLVPFAKSVEGGGVQAYHDFQPTCAIVDFYVDAITPDHGKFTVTYEHAEQGSDYDMDAIINYEYNVTSSDTISLKIWAEAHNGGSTRQHFGYIISGTTADGVYLDIKNAEEGGRQTDAGDPDYRLDTPGEPIATNPLIFDWDDDTFLPDSKKRTFTADNTVSAATLLRNPLYYAAKYGGSEDRNNDGVLQEDEWDRDKDGEPDTYFFVINPLRLEEKLNQSFADILNRASSGTAASVISNTRSGDGAVYQSLFYPERTDTTANANTVSWIGQVHSLLVDAYGNMREDTFANDRLDVTGADLNGNGRVYHEDINMNCNLDTETRNGITYTEDANGDGVLQTEFNTTGNPTACTVSFNASSDAFLSTLDALIVYEDGQPVRYYDVNGDGVLQEREKIWNVAPLVNDSNLLRFLWNSTEWLNNISDTNILTQRNTYLSNGNERFIFTWVDGDKDGIVDSSTEIKDFTWPTTDPVLADLADSTHFYSYLHLYSSFGDKPTAISDLVATDFEEFLLAETEREIQYIRGLDYVDSNGNPIPLTINSNTIAGTELRPRRYEGETWRLGDIAYSTPTAVGRPAEGYHLLYRDSSYAAFAAQYESRRTVIYTGANDGMLHAFNGGFYDPFQKQFCREFIDDYNPYDGDPDHNGVLIDSNGPDIKSNRTGCKASTNMPDLGSELWAYIPFNLLPHLHWLTEPEYGHSYYVDQKPRIFDAKIFPPDAVGGLHPNGWGTIMVVGMRFGGASIVADIDKTDGPYDAQKDPTMKSAFLIFDITDPEVRPTLLGEITMPEMGFSTSYPTMVVMKDGNHDGTYDAYDDGENRWLLAFGSGPADAAGDPNPLILDTAASSQKGKFFMLDLVKLVTSSELSSIDNNGDLTTGLHWYSEIDDNSFVSDPITVDFDLDYNADVLYYGTVSTDGTSWGGKMRRIVIDDINDSNDPDDDQDPGNWEPDSVLFDAGQPITAAATAGLDDDGRNWVFFGTGRYFVPLDGADPSLQSYYGIKEPLVFGKPLEKSWASVAKTGLIDTTSYRVFTDADRTVDNDGIATNWAALEADQSSHDGWFIDFVDDSDNQIGERNLGQAVLLGGALTFTTFTPSTDPCVAGGESWVWSQYYKTGTAYFNGILGSSPNMISFDDKNFFLSTRKISLGQGLATSPNLHVGSEEGSKSFVQTSTGAIEVIEQQNPFEVKSGIRSWRESD